jgi:hypothetical protein
MGATYREWEGMLKLYADRVVAITKHDVEQTTKRVRRTVGQLESYQIVKSVTYRR